MKTKCLKLNERICHLKLRLGVRGELLKALREDPEWRERLEKAKSVEEFREVINAFVKSKGYKVRDVEK